MSPTEQQIALCEWMGWEYHKPTPEELESGSYYHYEPNTSSLDVLHEMEKKLTDEQCRTYHEFIKGHHLIATHPAAEWVFHASASQRREALLRTLNLWKD